jgi:hypothetical protein
LLNWKKRRKKKRKKNWKKHQVNLVFKKTTIKGECVLTALSVLN